jgi:hypothetical protein
MKVSLSTPSSQACRPQRQNEACARADVIGGYIAGVAALFAGCVALVSLKAALLGFVFLHLGCALVVFVWWWQDSHRGDKAKPGRFAALKKEHKMAGTLLPEQTVSAHQ